ncbi:MAG: hypothetical protein HY513_01180 [Candidatus Aenigmarchaeota archaeon]|nr:hypothetical protein [Candidatus Aenigmarchaeota archaeon]
MQINEDFAKWFGLILSDGHIRLRCLEFYNKEETILKEFETLTARLFNLRTKRNQPTKTRRVIAVQVNSAELIRNLNNEFKISEIKKGYYGLPEEFMNSNNAIKAKLLQGLFDGDGSAVYNKKHHIRCVALASAKPKILRDVSKCLSDLGIKNRIDYKYGKVIVSRKTDISKFHEVISFTHPKRLEKLLLLVS